MCYCILKNHLISENWNLIVVLATISIMANDIMYLHMFICHSYLSSGKESVRIYQAATTTARSQKIILAVVPSLNIQSIKCVLLCFVGDRALLHSSDWSGTRKVVKADLRL